MLVLSRNLAASITTVEADYPVFGWHNLVAISNIEATSEDENFPATNLANPSTTALQGWRSTSTDPQYLTVTIASDLPVDYVGIAKHNFGSGNVTVSVEALTTGDDPQWIEVLDPFVPGDNSPLILRFEEVFCDGVRLKLVPTDTPPRAAVMYVGKLLVLPRGVEVGHTPITYGRRRNVITGRSQAGDYLGRIIVGGTLQTSVTINWLTPEWYRAHLDEFMEASSDTPFFWGWRPQTYPHEVGFAWLTSDPVPNPAHLAGYINVQFEMEGITS